MSSSNSEVFCVDCPGRKIMARLLSKWSGLVVRCLDFRTMRYSELRRSIGGISQKMLTQTLRELEADGLVERTVYPIVPPKVEYALTGLGRSLVGPLTELGNWVESHAGEIEAANLRYADGAKKSA
ncbi:MAG TPA: transcriptional regulator [Nitrospinae bacterium]|nr:transcriptional regulator [Nitrospinota bacterium]